MIEILLDHSFEDDYFMISDVVIKINDEHEKMRIEKLVKSSNLVGSLVDADNGLKNRIALLLKVDASILSFDTNEMDIDG